jgi:hypothetical protein
VTNVTTCGAGTKLVNGVCVVAGGEGDAGGGGGSDSGEPVEPGDGGADADVPEVDDPCPVADPRDGGTQVYNCDPTCGDVDSECDFARCRVAGEGPPVISPLERTRIRLGRTGDVAFSRVIVRLPRNPWQQFGECNPAQVSLDPSYTPMTPRPRWTFAIPFLDSPFESQYDKPYAVLSRGYGLRVFADARRAEPLPALPDPRAWGPDSDSCVRFNPRQLFVRYPASGLGIAALYTLASSMPARNILIKQDTTASCTGTP